MSGKLANARCPTIWFGAEDEMGYGSGECVRRRPGLNQTAVAIAKEPD